MQERLPELKTCSRCKKQKVLEQFNLSRTRKDGRQPYCRSCRKSYGNNAAYQAAYNASVPGIARQLVANYGYNSEEAVTLATDLLNPNERCGICGIPGWYVQLNHKRGGPFFIGGRQQNTRLHPDRINVREPHTLANTRILCPTCNMKRGAQRFTDEEVLRWVRYRWLSIFPPKKLWWLNSTPGEGGRLHRSPACEKRDAKFAERSLVEEAFGNPSSTEESS